MTLSRLSIWPPVEQPICHIEPICHLFVENLYAMSCAEPHSQFPRKGKSVSCYRKMAVLHAVANALECPICFEEFREPKTLSCKHSFCRRCLAKLLQLKYVKRDGSLQAPRKTTAIVCPTCNTSEVFHSLDDIGTFHVINNLLEAQVKERGETQEESFRCVCTKMAKICCYRLALFLFIFYSYTCLFGCLLYCCIHSECLISGVAPGEG